jgi:hypothetical protein
MCVCPLHPQITVITVANVIEKAVPQITILHGLGHNYNSISCDSEIRVCVYKTILLKQKKPGQNYEPAGTPGQSLQTGTYGNPRHDA